MKNMLPNVLVVIGFCLGAIGATGFHSPTASANGQGLEAEGAPNTENYAWAFLVCGIALMGGGAFLARGARADSDDGGKSGAIAAIREDLLRVQSLVTGMADSSDPIDDAQLMARIDEMRTGVLYDLGSRSDSFASHIGFDAYAQVWGDFAVCERLLNRCWSMTADGHGDEGRAELPLARAAIDTAVASYAALG